ncbi:MAG: adenine-specific methyltransferase EcoRI family protein [Pseudomonadota bacterium]|nr:adenine-specific methyltransferase EcoRI family protein [Pseudomonadota bacterium]
MIKAKPNLAPSGNRFLSNAKKVKQDEFYTQLGDISNELKHYKAQLRNKTILCNCDDPFESNFFKYFALNFNTLGLKKLIATSYTKSPIVGGQLPLIAIEGLKPEGKEPYVVEINEIPDQNGDGATDIADVEYLLKHNANTARSLMSDGIYSGGDFRSRECLELLQQADIVITNPPFSLFREYVAQLIDYDKQFLIIGSQNAISYKEVFKLIKENKVWLGVDNGGTKWFRVPDDYDIQTESRKKIENGIKYFSMGSIMWFTNMDNPKRHEEIPLYKKYSSTEYPKYDNYDAIEVSKVAEIPVDYDGAMGVPITFLDKYNPEQFEILGITDRDNNSGLKTKEYTQGGAPNPGDLNRRGVIRIGSEYKSTYARLLIMRKI